MVSRLETLASAIEQILARLPVQNNDDVVENVRVEAEKEIRKRASNFRYANVNQKPKTLWTRSDNAKFVAEPVEINVDLADKLANTNSLELGDLTSVYKKLCESTTLKKGDETQTIRLGRTHDQVFPRFQPPFVDDAFQTVVSKLWDLKWKAEYDAEKENLRKRYFLAKFSEPLLKPIVKAMAFDRDKIFPLTNNKRNFDQTYFNANRPEETIVQSFLRNILPPERLETAPLSLGEYTTPLIEDAKKDYVNSETEALPDATKFFVDMFLFFDPTTFLIKFDFTITETGQFVVSEQTPEQVEFADKQFEVSTRETMKEKFADLFFGLPGEFIRIPVPFNTFLNKYTELKNKLVNNAYREYDKLFVQSHDDVNTTLDTVFRLLNKQANRRFDKTTYNFVLQKIPFFDVTKEQYDRYVEEKLTYPSTPQESEEEDKKEAALTQLRDYFNTVKSDLSVFKNFVTYLFFEKNGIINARPDINKLTDFFETLSKLNVVLDPVLGGDKPAQQIEHKAKLKDEATFLKQLLKMYEMGKDDFKRTVTPSLRKNFFIKVNLFGEVETLIKDFPFFNEENSEHKTFVKEVAEAIFTFYDTNKNNKTFFVVPDCDRKPWTATFSQKVCDAYQQLTDALKPNPAAVDLKRCKVTETHANGRCTPRNIAKVYDFITESDGTCNASAPVLVDQFCEKCGKETPVWDGSQCTACPSDRPEWKNEKCNACTQNAPHFYNGKCNAQPPPQQTAIEAMIAQRRQGIGSGSPLSSAEWNEN